MFCGPALGVYVTVQLAELLEPDRLQEGDGVKIPWVLLLVQLTTPLGVNVPGGTSDTVTVQVVGTPIMMDEPQTTPVNVDIGLTVNDSQLLAAGLLFASPL